MEIQKKVEALKEKSEFFPDNPGVYIFESKKKPVYIGKAKNLKKRISYYFKPVKDYYESNKVNGILETADNLKFIVVNSEKEALLLEANLIYRHKPRFNTMLKDSRIYPYLLISDDDFPRILLTRSKKESGEYFGPFKSVGMLRELMDIVYKVYGIRPCDYDLKKIKKPCLEYHLGRCSAPCSFDIGEEYGKNVERLREFLKGNVNSLKSILTEKMKFYSENLLFEKAAMIRDILKQIDDMFEPQYVVLSGDADQDFFSMDMIEGKASIIRMKNGIMFSVINLDVDIDMSSEELFSQFYFGRKNDIPDSLVLKTDQYTARKIANMLEIEYVGPPRNEGEKKILEITDLNLQKEIASRRIRFDALKQLKITLGLKKLPRKIEGIDIAHTQGLYTVASVVSFLNGKPEKSMYRKYRITSLNQPDDFESMRIVIRRRFKKHPLPDLLLIDGGIGQVNAVKRVLIEELEIKDFQMIGLAKEEETIVFPDERGELKLPHDSPALRVLVSIRDESHRFANTFHSQLRDSRMGKSKLEDIPGIGKVRKVGLLRKFGSVKNIASAEIEEIAAVVGNRNLAAEIKKILSSE